MSFPKMRDITNVPMTEATKYPPIMPSTLFLACRVAAGSLAAHFGHGTKPIVIFTSRSTRAGSE